MFVSVNSLVVHFLSGNVVLISTKCSYPISLWWTLQQIRITKKEEKKNPTELYLIAQEFADFHWKYSTVSETDLVLYLLHFASN